MKILSASVVDIRVPTSDQLLGSDPFHVKPDYSSALLKLKTDAGLQGTSVVFTIGAGTDWICYGIKDLAQLVVGMDLDAFIESPIRLYSRLIDHHQARWLHDGVFRMACGAIINAMWDLWAKSKGVPLWKLMVDLTPDFVVNHCIDWRNLRDALTEDEALDILRRGREGKEASEAAIQVKGIKAYCTAGWTGLSSEQIHEKVTTLIAQGFDAFKLKVGRDRNSDMERLRLIRRAIGDQAQLMVDANQFWGLKEAQSHMQHYGEFSLTWVEEPIARDDVLGYIELNNAFSGESFKLACGEQAASPVIFKQLLKSGAIGYCQIDATRVAGVSDVMAIILMAAKYRIPVCPHGGGIGLCNMIQHYGIWDQIAVAGNKQQGQLVEYIDFLQDAFQSSVVVADGRYVAPDAHGWGLELKSDFEKTYQYPESELWKKRDRLCSGIHFEA